MNRTVKWCSRKLPVAKKLKICAGVLGVILLLCFGLMARQFRSRKVEAPCRIVNSNSEYRYGKGRWGWRHYVKIVVDEAYNESAGEYWVEVTADFLYPKSEEMMSAVLWLDRRQEPGISDRDSEYREIPERVWKARIKEDGLLAFSDSYYITRTVIALAGLSVFITYFIFLCALVIRSRSLVRSIATAFVIDKEYDIENSVHIVTVEGGDLDGKSLRVTVSREAYDRIDRGDYLVVEVLADRSGKIRGVNPLEAGKTVDQGECG